MTHFYVIRTLVVLSSLPMWSKTKISGIEKNAIATSKLIKSDPVKTANSSDSYFSAFIRETFPRRRRTKVSDTLAYFTQPFRKTKDSLYPRVTAT